MQVVALLLLAATACAGPSIHPTPVQPVASPSISRVDALSAFAKLYGYVRYFHPSDEASSIDWSRFAIHGAEVVQAANSPKQLARTLSQLFAPVAPTLQVYPTRQAPPAAAVAKTPTGAKVVAWQHLGAGLVGKSPVYQSARTHRKRTVSTGGNAGFGHAVIRVDAAPYRGKRVRYSAAVKADVPSGNHSGRLWLRVDLKKAGRGFFDNMADRPIKTATWKRYEIVAKVDADAEHIVFGVMLNGRGAIEVDDVRVEVEVASKWQPVPLTDPGFEAKTVAATGWRAANRSAYAYSLTTKSKTEGKQALRIEARKTVLPSTLFAKVPAAGEVITKSLGAGISARMPLALYSVGNHTLPRGSIAALRSILADVRVDTLTAVEERVRIAGVVFAWNVFQHFYPYFDVVKTDWSAVLTSSLRAALTAKTTSGYVTLMKRLVVALGDGHGRVTHAGLQKQRNYVPALAGWIEGKLVVLRSAVQTLRRGDVIVRIDDEPVAARYAAELELISGSPQWKRYRANRLVLAGAKRSIATLDIERNGRALRVHVQRVGYKRIPPKRTRPMIRVLRGGVYYVDLDRAPMTEISKRLADLAKAPGVVFDLRGYPKSNHKVLSHLLTKADTSKQWMQVAQMIYPDRERIVGWAKYGWELQPAQPHIGGKIVFLTNGGAVSYAESVMGLVAHYRLGAIVGEPTAGANGNVNPFGVPGGLRISWTGMRVVKHDGSQHHMVGVTPTMLMKPTLAGIRAGRDELLERGLKLILGSSR